MCFLMLFQRAKDEKMLDLNLKKLGLRDLLDSEFAGKGLD